MNTIYDRDLKAHLSLDDRNRVRHVRHSQQLELATASWRAVMRTRRS